MKSKIFDEIKTPVQFICTNNKVLTLKRYYALSASEKINDNYRHLYLTQEEYDVIELLSITSLKRYLIHLYAKYTKDYLHSINLSEKRIFLWYIENIKSEEFQGYLIEIGVKKQDIKIIYIESIYVDKDIGITKEEFDVINVLCDIHPTLAYPTALEIVKQYQPSLEV